MKITGKVRGEARKSLQEYSVHTYDMFVSLSMYNT